MEQISIDLQNTFGMIALMMGVYNGHMEIVELLMSYGADVMALTALKLCKHENCLSNVVPSIIHPARVLFPIQCLENEFYPQEILQVGTQT